MLPLNCTAMAYINLKDIPLSYLQFTDRENMQSFLEAEKNLPTPNLHIMNWDWYQLRVYFVFKS